MGQSWDLWLFIVAFLFIQQICAKIVQVQILFRHGARTPTSNSIPNYNVSKYFGKIGWGQLTNEGKRQQYELGQFFAKYPNYEELLSGDEFAYNKIFVQSSDTDRTLMSAYANLAGLFPPKNNSSERWNPKLAWQPIPVHTMPKDEDFWLRPWSACPRFMQEYKKALNSSQVKQYIQKHQKFMDQLKIDTGLSDLSLETLWKVHGVLWISKLSGYPLPPWMDDKKFAELTAMKTYALELWYTDTEAKRLGGGSFLKQILSRMKDLSDDGKTELPHFIYYSAHDTTITTVLSTMGLWKAIGNGFYVNPPFASAVMFELHKTGDNDFGVKIMYKNGTHNSTDPINQPVPLIVPGCKKPGICPLDTFNKYMVDSGLLPNDDIKTECKLIEEAVVSHLGVILLVVLSSVCVLTVAVISLLCCWRQGASVRRRRLLRYALQSDDDDDDDDPENGVRADQGMLRGVADDQGMLQA